jgi:hypothetical protein
VHCNNNSCIGRAKALLKIISDHHDVISAISDADISNMQAALQDFEDIDALPTMQIKEKKATATDIIPGLLNQIDTTKHFIEKHLRSNHKHLLAGWLAEIKVGKSVALRHISIAIKFVDAKTGIAVMKVKVTIEKGSEKVIKKSNKRGWIRAYSLETGTWAFVAENDIYESVIMNNIGVKEKKMVKMEIKLKKKGEGGEIV